VQDALRPAHFPEHVDVDGTPAARDLIGPPHLIDCAVDRVTDQFIVPVPAGECVIDLGYDAPLGIVAVRIDRRHSSDPAGSGPGAGAGVVGCRNSLSALDERKDLSAGIEDRPNTLEHHTSQIVGTPIGHDNSLAKILR
jgi:hypothetical protein